MSNSDPLPTLEELDPLPTLKKLHKYPISLLATLADHRGAVSGSRSLEIFKPGHGSGPDSDFDIYQPRNPDAVIDIMHTLRITGIKWENYIAKIFNDICDHGCAILPYETLYSMAWELDISPKNLEAYIKIRFDSSENCAKFAESFASALGGVYSLREPPEDAVWKHDNQDGTGTVIPLCETFGCLEYDLLKQFIKVEIKTTFEEVEEKIEKERENIEEQRKKIKEQRIKWKGLGIPKPFFWGYLLRRLRRIYVPQIPETRDDITEDSTRYITKEHCIRYIIKTFFPGNYSKKKPKKTNTGEERKTTELASIYPGFDFYMLRGTLEDGTRVQLMLLPPNESVLHPILKFYATHLMSFIGGIFAAHLYYDSAKELFSLR
ncbi:hypothetical protein A1F96_10309 [Pyrenophora tritici-repentis]|nr:hypothetical protein A1F96_10309 [Pyrenophora tritici-repentis]